MTFKIHPAIGIARVGDSTNSFYLAPEEAGSLPIDCDQDGNPLLDANGAEQVISKFKDDKGRVRRQGARFRVYAYDAHGRGTEVQIGQPIQALNTQTGQLMEGTVADIEWTVYLANKKASWYEFKELKGEHGYAADHPLRNSDITDPDARNQLIIDPGPQTVSYSDKPNSPRTAQFAKGQNPGYTQTFPPALQPFSIETLGELKVTQQDNFNRLVVLGGHGHSGSFKTGFGQPAITAYANNDGWFDDTSDGPVMARIKYQVTSEDGRPPTSTTPPFLYLNVDDSAWVIVGYPRFAPQILDIITLDEAVYDVGVRQFGYHPYLYGAPPFDGTQTAPDPGDADALALWREGAIWNEDYYPFFYRDIWPLLQRPNNYQWVLDFDSFTGGLPHDTGAGSNFDPKYLSVPPYEGEDPALREMRRRYRMRIWGVLRQPGQENQWTIGRNPNNPNNPKYAPAAMPFLCGDNPLTNTTPSKFLRLTDTQLFVLGQWALGKFVNEQEEDIPATDPEASAKTGVDLDRGVLSNLLGGSFCPGGEACWIIRNPAIYSSPYRINLDPGFALDPLDAAATQPFSQVAQPLNTTGDLQTGLQPGDLTKYSALPWQSDFNECATQSVDITYENWNEIFPASTGDPVQSVQQTTFWWPSHRPMEINTADMTQTPPVLTGQAPWSRGIPQTNQGDLKMVTAWKYLGFILNISTDPTNPAYGEVERNDDKL